MVLVAMDTTQVQAEWVVPRQLKLEMQPEVLVVTVELATHQEPLLREVMVVLHQ